MSLCPRARRGDAWSVRWRLTARSASPRGRRPTARGRLKGRRASRRARATIRGSEAAAHRAEAPATRRRGIREADGRSASPAGRRPSPAGGGSSTCSPPPSPSSSTSSSAGARGGCQQPSPAFSPPRPRCSSRGCSAEDGTTKRRARPAGGASPSSPSPAPWGRRRSIRTRASPRPISYRSCSSCCPTSRPCTRWGR